MGEKFRNDRPIEVEVDLSEESKLQDKRTGRLRKKRSKQPLVRRQEGEVYLNFWDLGQVRDGSEWKDLDFAANIGYTEENDPPGRPFKRIEMDSLTIADWAAYKAKLFEVPLNEWSTTYRKLDYDSAYRYGIDVYLGDPAQVDWDNQPNHYDMEKYYGVGKNNDRRLVETILQAAQWNIEDSQWTPEGLKVQKSPYFNLISLHGFHNIGLHFSVKITSENDYLASPVSFAINESTDFFLVPTLNGNDYISATEFPWLFNTYLNYDFLPISRETLLENEYFETETPANFGHAFNWIPKPNSTPVFCKAGYNSYFRNTGSIPEGIEDVLIHDKNRYGARQYDERVGEISTSTFFNGAGLIGLVGPEVTYDVIDGYALVHPGSLLAVAKQGSNYFYFWHSGIAKINGHPYPGDLSPHQYPPRLQWEYNVY